MPSVEFAEFGGRKQMFGLVMVQPRAGNTKAPQTARATWSVTKQIARQFGGGGGNSKNGIPLHYFWPAIDNVDENEAAARSERGFQPREGFGNAIEMMEGGVADNGVECFFQREPVGVDPAVFDVGCRALAPGDGEHGLGNIDGGDGIEVFGEFQGEQADAAAHVQDPATALGQMTDEEIMFAFQGDEGVIRFGDVIKGSGVVCLHAVEVYSRHGRMKRIFFERRSPLTNRPGNSPVRAFRGNAGGTLQRDRIGFRKGFG